MDKYTITMPPKRGNRLTVQTVPPLTLTAEQPTGVRQLSADQAQQLREAGFGVERVTEQPAPEPITVQDETPPRKRGKE